MKITWTEVIEFVTYKGWLQDQITVFYEVEEQDLSNEAKSCK